MSSANAWGLGSEKRGSWHFLAAKAFSFQGWSEVSSGPCWDLPHTTAIPNNCVLFFSWKHRLWPKTGFLPHPSPQLPFQSSTEIWIIVFVSGAIYLLCCQLTLPYSPCTSIRHNWKTNSFWFDGAVNVPPGIAPVSGWLSGAAVPPLSWLPLSAAEIIRIYGNNMALPQSLSGARLYLWDTSSFIKKLLHNVCWKMLNPEGNFTEHIKAVSPIVVPLLWTCSRGTQKYSSYLANKKSLLH